MRTRFLIACEVLALAWSAAAQWPTVPCTQGSWGTAFNHDEAVEPRLNAIHMTLLPTPGEPAQDARVLVWGHGPSGFATNLTDWSVFYPERPAGQRFPVVIQQWNTVTPSTPLGEGNLFCCAHTWLHSGRRLVTAGGTGRYGPPWNAGTDVVFEFTPFVGPNPAAPFGAWTRITTMAIDRYYAGACRLGDDRMVIAGGILDEALSVSNNTYEVYRGLTTQLDSHFSSGSCPTASTPYTPTQYCGPDHPNLLTRQEELGQYARLHLLANGQMFNAGPNAESPLYHGTIFHPSKVLHNPSMPLQLWTIMTATGLRWYGCSVRLPRPPFVDEPDMVLNMGGQTAAMGQATNSTEYCYPARGQLGTPQSGGWDYAVGSPMREARTSANAVVLPTGEVLVLGGSRYVFAGPYIQTPEILTGDVWTLLDQVPEFSPRGYHSAPVLLPSGKVLHGGGNARTMDYQIYSPWYIVCGYTRPVIQMASQSMTLGTTETVTFAPLSTISVTKVVLIRPGSATHQFDWGQRYVERTPFNVTSTSLQFTLPSSSNMMPRGHWMMFLLTNQNVPSEARWVEIQ